MTRLFAILTVCDCGPDTSNDNLSDGDDGLMWECPVVMLPDHAKLVKAAMLYLGWVIFRGYELIIRDNPDPEAYGLPNGRWVRFYLTSGYNDEDLVNLVQNPDGSWLEVDNDGCHTLPNGECASPIPCPHSALIIPDPVEAAAAEMEAVAHERVLPAYDGEGIPSLPLLCHQRIQGGMHPTSQKMMYNFCLLPKGHGGNCSPTHFTVEDAVVEMRMAGASPGEIAARFGPRYAGYQPDPRD